MSEAANPASAITATPAELPDWAQRATNLADPRLGAQALACSDDFFAPMTRLLDPAPAVFIPGKYDEHGKWMDGWESRRRRGPGHDWCLVRLGRPGTIAGVDIDTSHFTGNYPPAAALEGCPAGADPHDAAAWVSLLPATALGPDRHHLLPLPAPDTRVFGHVRLVIHPDGGVARLRVYGRIAPEQIEPGPDGLVDLLALVHGGRALAWNDAHFGAAANLILPGRGRNMGEGWETSRRRVPGHDWCILALGLPGEVLRIEVDTAHFKGNYPDRVSLQAAWCPELPERALATQSLYWPTLLDEQKLQADQIHHFEPAAEAPRPLSHVKLNLHPDGGVSRLRLWGRPA